MTRTDLLLRGMAKVLGYLVLVLMAVLVVASLRGREPGSLDDLDPVSIKQAVDRG